MVMAIFRLKKKALNEGIGKYSKLKAKRISAHKL